MRLREVLTTLHPGRTWRLVWTSARGFTLAQVVLLVVEGALPLAALYLLKLLIDAVSEGLSSPEPENAWNNVLAYVVAAGVIAFLSQALKLASEFVNEGQSLAVTDHVCALLHAKSIEADLAYYDNAAYYDTLHRAQSEAPFRPASLVLRLATGGRSALALVAVTGFLLSFSWIVVAALMAAALPGLLVRLRQSDVLYKRTRDWTSEERQASYYNWMLTRDTHAKEIRLFGLGRLFSERFNHLRRDLREKRLGLVRRRAAAELLAQGISVGALLSAYAYLAHRTLHGALTLGDLVMYQQALQRGQEYLRSLLASLSGLYEDNLFLTHLYDFLDLDRRVKEPERPRRLPSPPRRGLSLEGVSFRYPEAEREVLHRVDLEIPAGRTLALVGENGAGKTTLVKLLCRLYDPTEGRITWDGVDLREIRTEELRRQISVVFQDFAKFFLSARENIWIGDTALDPGCDRIEEAAREAGIDAVLRALPRGYESFLGKWFWESEELSVGEWQKIALARSFLRGAPLVILDEPTSALDVQAEEKWREGFRRHLEDRSAILISHRLSTVRMADEIAVLQGGRIVEQGTHDELMFAGGVYADFFDTQARRYR